MVVLAVSVGWRAATGMMARSLRPGRPPVQLAAVDQVVLEEPFQVLSAAQTEVEKRAAERKTTAVGTFRQRILIHFRTTICPMIIPYCIVPSAASSAETMGSRFPSPGGFHSMERPRRILPSPFSPAPLPSDNPDREGF